MKQRNRTSKKGIYHPRNRVNLMPVPPTLAVAAAVLFASSLIAFAACTQRAASSVEACHEPESLQATCSSLTSEALCKNPPYQLTLITVNDDFPTGCISGTAHCDRPLRDCWTTIECHWVDGECKKVEGSEGGGWQQKRRPENGKCQHK
jgi:hypothetical protein